MVHEILEQFRRFDTPSWIILAFLVVGWIVILERLFILQFVYRIHFVEFTKAIRKMIAAGDLERARAYCIASSKTGLPLIVAKALDAYQMDPFRVRMSFLEESLLFMPRIRRRIGQLPHLATAAVLVGAIASVQSVWQAFHTSNVLDGIKSFAFHQGMSQALNPLVLALFASLTLVIPWGILEAIATRLEQEMEYSITVVMNLIAPETQAVFSSPMGIPQGGSAAHSHSGLAAAAAGGGAIAHMDDDMPSLGNDFSSNGGKNDDMDNSEIVPDEEEII